MERIIILGNGGHAKSVVDAIECEGKYKIEGYITNDKVSNIMDYPIIGTDDDLGIIYQDGVKNVAMGIGFMGRSDLRKRLYAKLKNIGYKFPVICDPSAIISKHTVLGEGTFVGKRAVINSNAVVEQMSIINTGAVIEHDCKVGAFTHISVGTVLCGGVIVGEESFVGANATIIQNISVAPRCIIGAGEVLRKDILMSESIIAYGKNSCKKLLQ